MQENETKFTNTVRCTGIQFEVKGGGPPGGKGAIPETCTWGAVPGWDADTALQKAKAMKAEALGLRSDYHYFERL